MPGRAGRPVPPPLSGGCPEAPSSPLWDIQAPPDTRELQLTPGRPLGVPSTLKRQDFNPRGCCTHRPSLEATSILENTPGWKPTTHGTPDCPRPALGKRVSPLGAQRASSQPSRTLTLGVRGGAKGARGFFCPQTQSSPGLTSLPSGPSSPQPRCPEGNTKDSLWRLIKLMPVGMFSSEDSSRNLKDYCSSVSKIRKGLKRKLSFFSLKAAG